MIRNGTIVYVGPFELPDVNAAAHRVLANAQIFKTLGFKTIFIETGRIAGAEQARLHDVSGLRAYRVGPPHNGLRSEVARTFGHSDVLTILDQQADVDAVIAYNYPAIALIKLQRYCRKRKIKCLADVTEWKPPRLRSPAAAITALDTSLRMRVVHKHVDGVIVISRFLNDYYRASPHILQVPPLVDMTEPKWSIAKSAVEMPVKFIYAGSPSARKECLDEVVRAFSGLDVSSARLDIYGVTADEYSRMYGRRAGLGSPTIHFHGRVNHADVVMAVARANYALVIRDDSRLVRSGFPTKFVESVSAGTPVIATAHPDLIPFLQAGKFGHLTTVDTLSETLAQVLEAPHVNDFDRAAFDFRHYVEDVSNFFQNLGIGRYDD